MLSCTLSALGYHPSLRLYTWSRFPQVSVIDVADVREVSQAHYLLQCHANADCLFEVFVHKADAYTLSDLTIYDPDWNDHYVLGQIECQARFNIELEVAIDSSGSGRHGVKILSIEVEPTESNSNLDLLEDP